VTNWAGALNGGGANRLTFGQDGGGLSAAQVGQIEFINPVGLSPGAYSAQVLATGEVVPISSSPEITLQNGALTVSWSAGWTLQSATNAAGPYVDMPEATSPYSETVSNTGQKFFRLRK